MDQFRGRSKISGAHATSPCTNATYTGRSRGPLSLDHAHESAAAARLAVLPRADERPSAAVKARFYAIHFMTADGG